MARGPKVKAGSVRIPVREEKRLAATTPVAQPAGFDVPRAQPPVTPAPPIVKQKEPVMVPIKKEPISSLVSPFDTQADPFVSTVDTDVQEIDGKADILKDKEARLAAYGTNSVRDVYAQLLAEAPDKARTGRDLYREFDPGRGAMQGYNAETYNQAVNIDRPLAQAMEDFEIPAYVEYKVPELDTGGLEYDKTRLYTNYGQRGQLEFPSQEARDEYYEKERTGTFHDISKLLGITDVGIDSQTMVWVKDPPEPSKWEKFLGNPVLSLVGALYPPVALATTGLKAASGMDVSPVEIASGLMTGLNMSGVTAPPSASAMPVGQMGPGVANTGRGLFGTTYAQTQTALNVAAAGDVEGAALALVGQPLINRGLDAVGLDQATIEGAGIQYDDLQEGIGRAVAEVAGGAELDEALAAGVGKYISEGGTLGVDLPDGSNIDLGVIEDVVRDVVRPIGAVGTAIVDFVEDALDNVEISETVKELGRNLDDQVLQPIKEVAETTGSTIEDVVRAGGSAVDDAVIQPVQEVAKDVDDAVIQPVGDALSTLDTAIREVAPDIEDFVRDVVNPLDNFVDDIQLPDVDLPNMSLPDVNISLPGLTQGMGLLSAALMPQPATATTNKIFDNELFKFKTEIGITDRDALIDIEDFLTSPFESSFAQTGRF